MPRRTRTALIEQGRCRGTTARQPQTNVDVVEQSVLLGLTTQPTSQERRRGWHR